MLATPRRDLDASRISSHEGQPPFGASCCNAHHRPSHQRRDPGSCIPRHGNAITAPLTTRMIWHSSGSETAHRTLVDDGARRVSDSRDDGCISAEFPCNAPDYAAATATLLAIEIGPYLPFSDSLRTSRLSQGASELPEIHEIGEIRHASPCLGAAAVLSSGIRSHRTQCQTVTCNTSRSKEQKLQDRRAVRFRRHPHGVRPDLAARISDLTTTARIDDASFQQVSAFSHPPEKIARGSQGPRS